jgi:hypothetical protein
MPVLAWRYGKAVGFDGKNLQDRLAKISNGRRENVPVGQR